MKARLRYIILVLIGCFLVYLGVFGPALPSHLLAVSTIKNTVTDDFNDNSINQTLWTIICQGGGKIGERNQRIEIFIDPTISGFAGLQTRAAYNLSSADISVDVDLGSGPWRVLQISPYADWEDACQEFVRIWVNELGETRMTKLSAGITTDIYSLPPPPPLGPMTFQLKISGSTVNGYYRMASGTVNMMGETNLPWPSNSLYVSFFDLDILYWGGDCHFDNFVMAYETVPPPPPPPPPPPSGTLVVKAWDRTSGQYITLTGTLTDPDGISYNILISSVGFTVLTTDLGTWSVTGSYGSVAPTTDTKSGILTANSTLTLTLEFGSGSEPPPELPPPIWESARPLFFIVGLACVGIGTIKYMRLRRW